MKIKHWLIPTVLLLVLTGSLCGIMWWRLCRYRPFQASGNKVVYLHIWPNATWQQVSDTLIKSFNTNIPWELSWLLKNRSPKHPLVGAYAISPTTTVRALHLKLSRGLQDPIRITFRSERFPSSLYNRLAQQILADSSSIATAMEDSLFLQAQKLTLPSLAYYLLPNTYEVYWTVSPTELRQRLNKARLQFWNATRLKQAQKIGLSPEEVITLASIVQEESAQKDEYPTIAGLYLHRLRIDMLLQADPTVKYAVGDFSLRRILNVHLSTPSPYNTYLHKGLPPTPLRIPYSYSIDGVLQATDEGYLYMCAKEDFSGYHNFARTYREHLQNARKYVAELNKRNIK